MDKDLVGLLKNLSEESLADFVEGLPPIEREVLLNTLHDYEKSLERERSQKDFMSYVKGVWPGFIPGRHHSIIAEKFERIASGEKKRLIICLPPRHALTLTTKVPTPNGWTTIANLKPGDFVFGPDGLPTKVLGKSEVFKNQQIYRVHTDDGAYLDVDGEHLWTVRLDRKFNKYHTYKTEDLYRRQSGEVVVMTKNGPVFRNTKLSQEVRKPRLPNVQPVQYPEQHLPIDPYVLGIWLGDGHSSQAIITCSDEDAKIIRPEIERRGYKTTDQATSQTYGILDLKIKLRDLGLLGNKRIPSQYLIGSEQQRRDLLRGLMDTDGNISKTGQCYFAQSNKAFITQVAELVSSLGVKVSILESEAKIGDKSYGPTWKLSFYAQDIAFLPRKESRTIHAKRFGRYIRIEKLNQTADTQCIRVEREDGLFLAGKGYIVTHNTKSEFGSYLLPAWFLGRYPNKKIIQCSNTAELAVGFGRKVRNLVDSDLYSQIFPDVKLRVDSKAAGRWSTNKNGEYFAIGVGGTVTGKGADLLIIDDPHSEQEAASAIHDPKIYDKVYEWYTSGPRQRLQPGGAIVVIMTRWGKRDLVGQVLKAAAQRGGEDWEVIEFPAIMPSGKPLWPEFWSLKELEALREELPNAKWQAQYQQNPVSEESAVIKREWWKQWEYKEPPECDFVLQAWDTAFEKHNRADYSACTTWGVFYQNDDNGEPQANIILLNAVRERVEFPQLKKLVLKEYKEWEPDSVVIEKKASGAPLIYELRAMGVMVQEFTPVKGNDKINRLNAVSDIFASGRVWAPVTSWAEEVIDEVAGFPNSEHDDYVDTVSLALMRFRKGGYIRAQLDQDDEPSYTRRRQAYY